MNSKSFTLVELLVVTGIIVFLTALTLPNYRFGDRHLALQRSAHKMAQSLRMAQEYAISAKASDGVVPAGYGMYFDLDVPTLYILFADLNGDQRYSSVNEKVEEINLETDISLVTLNPIAPGSSLTIVFIPPDPTIVFYPDASSVTVTLKTNGAEAPVSKNIRINKAGLIAVE